MARIVVTVRPVDLPDAPRAIMARLRETGNFALLESALPMPRQAEWSYIAGPGLAILYTDETATRLVRDGNERQAWVNPFDALAAVAAIPPDGVRIEGECPEGMNFVGGWVGILGYDVAQEVEGLPDRVKCAAGLPRQWWMAVDQVLAFHHSSRTWWQATARGPKDRWPWSGARQEGAWDETLKQACGPLPQRRSWHAGPRQLQTSREQFEQGIIDIREAIARGDVLQVNLTRREESSFDGDPWSLYEDLMAMNPAPFSAYLEGPGFAIASCSPERFLRRRGDHLEARPIKGTVARGTGAGADAAQRHLLATSGKDRAENVMIVDLMRNDLGRVAVTGSVQVPELFALEPYASVWQMVSTVHAQLRPDCGTAELLRACWPPGSMTGAPKLKAMQIIEAMEPVRRGFYAGSIGYLDCRGNMDLSVVIRTAIVTQGRVMAQFGSGIVADSDPPAEWAETVAKGRCIVETLARSSARRSHSPRRLQNNRIAPTG